MHRGELRDSDRGGGSGGPGGRALGVFTELLVCRQRSESLPLLLTLAESYILIMRAARDKAAWQADKSAEGGLLPRVNHRAHGSIGTEMNNVLLLYDGGIRSPRWARCRTGPRPGFCAAP